MIRISDNDKFTLEFDPTPSKDYPDGYWYAKSAHGDYDADGATPLNALAALVITLDNIRLEGEEHD